MYFKDCEKCLQLDYISRFVWHVIMDIGMVLIWASLGNSKPLSVMGKGKRNEMPKNI